ncbi:MAG: efflux RND transporter periplasmic adaptor subunit [Saprospiraceae bacterium]|nr:efflux RND transporter periplasmic adaptor subunit [Saprospiraceae bacterium]MDW8230860.1 efflux RND transporter periplasmic adaptor subunit [Saprospiraceae bacterium]
MRRYYLWLLLLVTAILIGWKLYDNQKRRHEEAKLSQSVRSFVPVHVAVAESEWLTPQLEAGGILMPSREIVVISETMGRVVEVYKRRGDRVAEKEVIAKVDDELLRVKFEAVEANLAKLRRDRERLSNLIEGEAAPRSKIEDLDLALKAAEAERKVLQKQLDNTYLRAPMSGTLTFCALERGGVVGTGTPVAHITNLDRLLLMVKVSERDVLQVSRGQAVEVRADVRPDMPLSGRVVNVSPKADSAFTYLVEIEVPNPPQAPLLGGMHAKARFLFDQKRQAILIPRRAISGSLQDARVFVATSDTTVEARTIQLGQILGERVEVRSGLVAGERVVVAGQTYLHEGVRVRINN